MVYVGSTVNNYKRRWNKQHRSMLRGNRHYNQYLQNAWNKYGENAFEYVAIEFVEDVGNLIDREQYWRDYYAETSGVYNLGNMVDNPRRGQRHTNESKQKIREATLEQFKNQGHPFEGKSHSDETKKKIRDTLSDRIPNEDTRRKISQALKGRRRPPRSDEWCKAISEAKKGMTFSEETRKKWSISRTGKGNSMYGKKHSEQSKRKMSQKAKQRTRKRDALGRYI